MREKQGVSKLEFLSRLVAIGGVFLAACGPDSEGVKATVFAEIAQTPTATYPATPDVQAAIGIAFAERDRQETEQAGRKTQVALDAIAATTATLSAEQALAKEQQPISDFLASRNRLADETQEYTQVDLDRFKDYFSTRYLAQAGGKNVYAVDLMFAQLAQPVRDLKDRGANFHRRNEGQGLGFSPGDLPILRSLDDLLQADSGEVFLADSDGYGYKRSWAIGGAKDFETAVLAFVDGWLAESGISNPGSNPLVAPLRRATFERIVYQDLGVKPGSDKDGDWATVSDEFDTCTTFAANAQSRAQQPERVRGTHFDPNLESVDGVEQESIFHLDSRNSILVSAVIDEAGNYLRVEVNTLSNPPDVLGGYPNRVNAPRVEAHGARWVPCGVEVFVTATGIVTPVFTMEVTPTQPSQLLPPPEKTPRPPEDTSQPGAPPQKPEATVQPPPPTEVPPPEATPQGPVDIPTPGEPGDGENPPTQPPPPADTPAPPAVPPETAVPQPTDNPSEPTPSA